MATRRGVPSFAIKRTRKGSGLGYGGIRGQVVKNPLTSTHLGGRLLSASQLPLFWLRPPRGYGVLTTIGRKTGKRRSRCVRAPTEGDRAYVVALHGMSTHWARNAEANPEVSLRVRGGSYAGIARRLDDGAEWKRSAEIYSGGEIGPFERLEYRLWRKDKPTREKIRKLHREWFERGAPFVIELRRGRPRSVRCPAGRWVRSASRGRSRPPGRGRRWRPRCAAGSRRPESPVRGGRRG